MSKELVVCILSSRMRLYSDEIEYDKDGKTSIAGAYKDMRTRESVAQFIK